ncbi:MAG: protein kinase [Deltaproteobacteria bacterium]|nr:protein kinase [Deltaproteobacteria bacterium]
MKLCPKCNAPLGGGALFCTQCGATLPTQYGTEPEGDTHLAGEGAPDPEAGRVVDGKYVIVRVIGEGGMGVVYLARELLTDSNVVLKAVRPDIAHRSSIRERTLAEGRTMARIDHPNVVQLKTVVSTDDELWLVMQYVEGETLEDTIARHVATGQPMPLDAALGIFRQVLAGVEAAHQEGVIHRDLKPANIMLRQKDGVVKVTDFGIAKPEEQARAGQGDTKGVIGSVNYMSPEQIQGQRELDRRVDIYSLGLVFYEMLASEVPFDGDTVFATQRLHIEEPFPSLSVRRPDVPPVLDGILKRACAKRREDRFASCQEFLQGLEGIAQHGAPPPFLPAATHVTATVPGAPDLGGTDGTITSQPATVTAPQPSSGGRGWLLPLVAVVVLGAGGTALWFSGLLPTGEAESETDPSDLTEPPPSATQTVTASATVSAAPASPLAALVGRWMSDNGVEVDAVMGGDSLELRVVDPAQFGLQDYRAGEVRLILHPIEGEAATFAVEDRVRPLPPTGRRHETANARGTCLAIWTSAAGKPLRAKLRGDRLDVDVAKIEPKAANFIMAGGKVVSCRGLEKLAARRLPMTLNRR